MDLLVFGDVTLIMILIRKELDWDYEMTLEEGIRKTYNWIMGEIAKDVAPTLMDEGCSTQVVA